MSPSSPPKAAFASDPSTVSDQYLTTTTPMPIDAGDKLSFANKYLTESGYDGGVVEVSTDGGSTWVDLAPNFTQNGYNGTLSTCCSNPLPGRQAFTGDSGGYLTTTADLSPFAGRDRHPAALPTGQ